MDKTPIALKDTIMLYINAVFTEIAYPKTLARGTV